MSGLVDRMTGTLYRIGLHHEDGASSMVSLAAQPIRAVVGEAAASAADALVNANHRHGSASGRGEWSERSGDIGPSTV